MTRRRPPGVPQPKYPALRKKCKYCKLEFTTPATANGQKMEFCKSSHRWAFAREGKKPIDWILKKYEKRMREIAREEVRTALAAQRTMMAEQLRDLLRTEPNRAERPDSRQSV
jgi:hypothetical protein